jgi:hypothetical protein
VFRPPLALRRLSITQDKDPRPSGRTEARPPPGLRWHVVAPRERRDDMELFRDAFEQVALEVEPHHQMKTVSHFVGGDTDQRRCTFRPPDLVLGAICVSIKKLLMSQLLEREERKMTNGT